MLNKLSTIVVHSVSFSIAECLAGAKYMGTRGILYNGDGCDSDEEYLLFQKNGPFDGQELFLPDPHNLLITPYIHIDSYCIGRAIDLPPTPGGSFNHKYDAIIYGKLAETPLLKHRYSMTDIQLLLLQSYIDFGKGEPSHLIMSNANGDSAIRELGRVD